MSDDQDHPRRGGEADTERALDELRVALEQLAARMGAGFREDLAQIRAIAASVAERDLTADVEALRVDVATLVGRDSSGLAGDVAALRAEVARLASSDDVATGVRSELSPLQAAVDRVSARLDDDSGRAQVLARFERLESRLDELAGGDGSAEVLARIDALAARLDSLPSSRQIADLPGDLRAHLADALAGFDGDAVSRELASIRSELGAGNGPLLEQLQDNLADVASGEVVGALWDELRQLRTDLPDLITVPEPVAAPAHEPDPQLAALTDELAVLRTELAEGLVVEPSDALSASLDTLKDELDELRAALGDLRDRPEPAPAPVDDGRDEELLGQLQSIRTSLDAVQSRLDEGLVLDDGDESSGAPDVTDRVDAVADQVASLRGFVAAEIEGIRGAVDDLRDRPEPVAAPVDDGRDEELLGQLASIRGAVDALRSRLDDAGEPVVQPEPFDRAELVAIVADQVSSLRTFVGSELGSVREAVGARLDAAAEVNADAVAAALAEPTDATTSALDALRAEIDGLRATLADASASPEPADDGRDEQLLERLAVLQSGIDEVRIRLDDGVRVAEAEPAVDAAAPDGAGIEALADQVAALRDFVASELDTVRQTMAARLDAAAEATAAAVATATARPEPEPAPAPAESAPAAPAIDAEVIDTLRDEIRASGAIGDQVVDALREELKALRRRIAVKAAERVLDDQQLAQIADAVAARLAEGRDPS